MNHAITRAVCAWCSAAERDLADSAGATWRPADPHTVKLDRELGRTTDGICPPCRTAFYDRWIGPLPAMAWRGKRVPVSA